MNYYLTDNRRIRISVDGVKVFIYSWRSNREIEHTYSFRNQEERTAFLKKVFRI